MSDNCKKQIAVLFSVAQCMQVMRGIVDYVKQKGNWQLLITPESQIDMPPKSLVGWSGDGVILRLCHRTDLELIRELRIPVININGSIENSGLPSIMRDQEAMGHLAAEHLLKCGLQQFAYFGIRNTFYSKLRCRGFIKRIQADGYDSSVLELPHQFSKRQPWYQWNERIERWLESLKKPVGLFVVHDPLANLAVEVCSRIGFEVPHDVAVVGVENNEVICELAETPITSIAQNNWKIGFEGAALLDRLIDGHPPPVSNPLVAPVGVVARESTDIVIVDDPCVLKATRYIRDHLTESFGVETLEKITGMSRRSLQLRFNQCLGCTPHQYISQVRVRRAKSLLVRNKTMKLKQISLACGFSDMRCFRRIFQQATKMTPAEYKNSYYPKGIVDNENS